MSTKSGVKYDTEKSPVTRGVLQYFPRALEEVAKVSAAGAKKYAWNGWKTVPDGITRYSDALGRHLLAEGQSAYDDGPDGTGCLHAAQVAWNALARLELILRAAEKPGAIGPWLDWRTYRGFAHEIPADTDSVSTVDSKRYADAATWISGC